jgi:hypothetical protein
LFALVVLGAVIAFGVTRQQKVGTYYGVPYDWRLPTIALLRERFWNPGDSRILTPKVFGWGWPINVAAIARKLGLLK